MLTTTCMELGMDDVDRGWMIWMGSVQYEWSGMDGGGRLPFINYGPRLAFPTHQFSNFESSCCNFKKAIAFLLL